MLETEERAEGYSNVVVRAACPIDLVARFQPKTDGAEMSFHACARVKHSTDVVRSQILHRTRKLAEARGFRIQLEIDEPALHEEKRANRVMSSDEFESAEPMQHLEIAARYAYGAARAYAALNETLIEVVVHFSLEHDVREPFVSNAPSQSCHVRAGLVDAEVIPVRAHLKMILRGSQRHKPNRPCQECQAQE